MKVSYCPTCKPVVILAIGETPTEIIVKGKKKPVKPPSHVAGAEIHTAKAAEVKDLPRLPGESVGYGFEMGPGLKPWQGCRRQARSPSVS